MSPTKSLLELLHHRPVPFAGTLAVLLVSTEVVIDWGTWIQLNIAILYTVPLVLAAAARSRRLLWVLVTVSISTTFAVYFVQIPRGAFSLGEPFFVNRLLAAVAVLLTAALLHAWTLALDKLEAQNEELDRRRQEAEAASGRKSHLLASVSHDLRSPLNVINLTAEILRRSVEDPSLAAEVPGLARRLQTNALSLAELVTDVLDIAAIDSGRVDLRESEMSLDELLTEECRRLLPLAKAKNLRLSAEATPPSVRLRIDRVKLTRVLNNLITNAIKFTEQGGVTLTASLTPERAVLIRVCDTGVGIAPEDRERIFDEFAQLRNPNRDRGKGWGLGLAICRRLVEVMGGTIAVESQPDRGSTFEVRLPPCCVVAHPAACETSAARQA